MQAGRDWRISLLKAVACVLIVLHHAVRYSPWAQHLQVALPILHTWLNEQASMVVQWFLVAGGYLAFPAFQAALSQPPTAVLGKLGHRFIRLTTPLWLALALAVLISALMVRLIPETAPLWAPDLHWPSWWSHSTLTQDWFGHTALSAGVWYVAIDLQLFALGLGLSLSVSRLPRAWPWLCASLVLLSLWHANTDPGWDVSALYFFGAYGAGTQLAWAEQQGGRTRAFVLTGLLVALLLAQALHWRDRLCWAAVALLLLAASPALTGPLRRWGASLRWAGLVEVLARRSYGIFLIHYALIVAISSASHSLWARWGWMPTLGLSGVAVLLLWASFVAGGLLERAAAWRSLSPRLRWALYFLIWSGVCTALLV